MEALGAINQASDRLATTRASHPERGRPRLLAASFRFAPAIGGAENYARRLYQEIGDRLQIEVATLMNRNGSTRWLSVLANGERPAPQAYAVDGRKVTALPSWPVATRSALGLLSPGYHFPVSPVPTLMARLIAPHLACQVADVDLVHCPFMGREAFSLAFLMAAQRAGIRFVFTPLRHERPLGWNSPAFRKLYRESDAIIALTRHEAAWLEAQGAPSERLHVIGAGPLNDPRAPLATAHEALGHDKPFVLFLGQLHPYKGYQAVLDAARQPVARDVLFVFAGPDVKGNARVFDRAQPNVRYLGKVDDRLRDSLLNACTVLCVPSTRESFGIVFVEAWAAGRPVIGGTAPATQELIEDGVDGWTVRQDPSLIADRVARLVENPSLATRMGTSGRAKVARRFSWPVIADAHVGILERLLTEAVR